MQAGARRFSTSLSFLDRRLGGGLPVTSIIGLLAPSASQSQLLLRAVTRRQPLLYISTSWRNEDELERWLATPRRQRDDVTVRYVPPETLVEDLNAHLQAATPESFLVIDAVNPLEQAPRSEYLTFLNDLKQWLVEHDSVAFLHCLDPMAPTARRSLTLNRIDQIWWLQMQLLSQDITNKLYITKARTGQALTEPIPLVLTDQVRIDTSRNI